VEEVKKTPIAQAVEQAAKQPAPEVDPVAMFRQVMAQNFVQHCVNAAVAEKVENPAMEGVKVALNELLVATFNQGDIQQAIGVIANAIATVGFDDGSTLADQLMGAWAVAASRNNKINMLLGRMRDEADADFQAFTHNQIMALRNEVFPPAPEEAVPAAEAEQAESLPAEAAPEQAAEAVPVTE